MPSGNRTTVCLEVRAGVPAAGRCRHLGRRADLLLLIAAWVLLLPLAAARPVDPTWIKGLYDDGDFDNVVTLIASLVGATDAPAARAARPDWQTGPPAPSGSWFPATRSLLRPLGRSPPQGGPLSLSSGRGD